jgi:tetratricopeptide (TPR) repeat protein/transcriptional regulator with XRE-family HTH domain
VTTDLRAPDPRRIVTRHDFGQELTLAKEHAQFTVRQIAENAGIPASTVGGYLAGRHLPDRYPPDLLQRVLRACGITDRDTLALWQQAYWRVRRSTDLQETAAEDGAAGDRPDLREPAEPLRVAEGTSMIPVSTVPPLGRLDAEPHIRGRQKLLDELRTLGGPAVHVLHGLGGCGKSAVALTVAREAATKGTRCWWLTARDAASLAAGMTAIALELNASPEELRLGSLPDMTWKLLNSQSEPWLLIIDEADDPAGVLALPGGQVTDGTGWVRPPRGHLGRIIVTTTMASWGEPSPSWLRLHRVPRLTAEEGADVLIEVAGPAAGERPEAAALADRLGGLPLALVLTGRYLAEVAALPVSWMTPDLPADFASYLAALGRGAHAEPLASVPLGLTWELSLDLLTDRGLGNARPLLRLLSCLGPAPIPYELLLRSDIVSASGPFSPVSPRQLWATLRGLGDIGLIELDITASQVRTLMLHPVVRDIARQEPAVRRDLPAYLALTTALLTRVLELSDPKQPRDWGRWQLLADHCTAPLGLVSEPGSEAPLAAIDLAARAAGFLRAAGHLAQADAAYATVLDAARRKLPARDPRTLALQHDLARLHYDQGRLREAEQLFRQVTELRSAVLGAEHPDTLTSRHHLARVLRDRGLLDDAETVLGKTLEARLRILGPDHPDTLTSSNGLADLLRVRGQLAEARDAYQHVLDQRGRVLGELHPATLTTRHYLAQVRHRLDEPGAESELRDLIRASTNVRGATHPRTLAVLESLVEALHDHGHLREAEEYARQLVADRRRVLGSAHPKTLASRHRHGLILLDLGAWPEAEDVLADVLTDRQRVLGSDHPSTILSRETLEAVRRRTV